MTPTPAAPSGEQIRFRFFKNLVEAERRKVFEVFGVIPEGSKDRLNHSIEALLLKRMLKGFRAAVSQAAPEQAVRYELRMHAPNENTGPWYECTEAAYKQFTANGYIGDGFFNETRALGVIALAAPSGAPKQENVAFPPPEGYRQHQSWAASTVQSAPVPPENEASALEALADRFAAVPHEMWQAIEVANLLRDNVPAAQSTPVQVAKTEKYCMVPRCAMFAEPGKAVCRDCASQLAARQAGALPVAAAPEQKGGA